MRVKNRSDELLSPSEPIVDLSAAFWQNCTEVIPKRDLPRTCTLSMRSLEVAHHQCEVLKSSLSCRSEAPLLISSLRCSARWCDILCLIGSVYSAVTADGDPDSCGQDREMHCQCNSRATRHMLSDTASSLNLGLGIVTMREWNDFSLSASLEAEGALDEGIQN